MQDQAREEVSMIPSFCFHFTFIPLYSNPMQHVKHYNDIRVTYDKLIKKMINYANTTD